MTYSTNKDINKAVRQYRRQGWTFEHGGKHGKLWTPDGGNCVLVPFTPGDNRASKNFMAQIKRLERSGVIA